MQKVPVQVMLTKEDRDFAMQIAKREGRPMSNYMRSVIEAHLERERKISLSRIGQ